jgi:hypothetical protein
VSEYAANHSIKKRHRAVFVSVSLLAVLVAGSLVFAAVEKLRDSYNRAH